VDPVRLERVLPLQFANFLRDHGASLMCDLRTGKIDE
jgi:hypothetical protein